MNRSKVIEILEKNRNKILSGQQIADQVGITRMAINKIIASLKEDGFIIETVKGRGYLLRVDSDVVTKEGISVYLSKDILSFPIYIEKSIDSTNRLAKEMANIGVGNGTLVIAEEQTQGRGRLGRDFYSPKGTGIYMSMVLNPNVNFMDLPNYTVIMAVAICKAIEKLTDIEPKIKWVNDIFVRGKKVAGILTEAVTDIENGQVNNVVVGVGINFKSPSAGFPDELFDIATGLDYDGLTRNKLIGEIVNQFYDVIEQEESHVSREYKSRSFLINKTVEFKMGDEKLKGKVMDINNKGNLVISMDNGEEITLISGEITLGSEDIINE